MLKKFKSIEVNDTPLKDIFESRKWFLRSCELNQYGVCKLRAFWIDPINSTIYRVTVFCGYTYVSNLCRKHRGHHLDKIRGVRQVRLIPPSRKKRNYLETLR
jgi:hypothetical protein